MNYPVTYSFDMTSNPFNELSRLHRQMSRLFDSRSATDYPAANLYANDEQATLKVAAPGFDEKSLSITITGDVVSIEGTRPEADGVKPEACHRRERASGSFSRSIRLPFEVETDRTVARFENGLLTVTLPRKESTKPRRVNITTA